MKDAGKMILNMAEDMNTFQVAAVMMVKGSFTNRFLVISQKVSLLQGISLTGSQKEEEHICILTVKFMRASG
jgi:hypothetical protein